MKSNTSLIARWLPDCRPGFIFALGLFSLGAAAQPLAAQVSTVRVPVPLETDLRHTLGPFLPTPGKTPAWPLSNTGKWRVDVAASRAQWLKDMTEGRTEHLIRMGYDDAEYRRPELQWAQRNFVHTQMMAEDRYFYDPVAGKYTVDKYLDDLQQRYGGIDSVLIWYVYTNIGIDNRNQTDLGRDLPGGVAGLKQAVADFHRRGVRVFLPTMGWDNGTHDPGAQWDAIAKLTAEVGADGVNGDTYTGVPRKFRQASDATGHPVVFEPESPPQADEGLMWNNQSWGKASTEMIPAVSKLKWLEPRHMVNVEDRWARERSDDFHYVFFNGLGYVSWENVWGIWNQFTPRDAETLRRIALIEHKFADLLISPDWEPYAHTLQKDVFASEFPRGTATLWTIVNRNEYELTGEQLSVAHRDGRKYYDVWNGVELQPQTKRGAGHLQSSIGSARFWRGSRGGLRRHRGRPRVIFRHDEGAGQGAAAKPVGRMAFPATAACGNCPDETGRECTGGNGVDSGR